MSTHDDRVSAVELARTLRIDRVLQAVSQLWSEILAAEQEYGPVLSKISPVLRESAYNLVHYLAVRRHDLRPLQADLSQLGLSSLGRMEAHVMATLQAVLQTLHSLAQQPLPQTLCPDPPITFDLAHRLLQDHANALFGYLAADPPLRIMVTMPSLASQSPQLVEDLLAQGMAVMRINCAHDRPADWQRMIDYLRRAESRLGRRCRVSFDLAGPKLRTVALDQQPGLVKWRARGDTPTTLWLLEDLAAATGEAPCLPVGGALLQRAQPGDQVSFIDQRGDHHTLTVVAVEGDRCACQATQSGRVGAHTPLTLLRQAQPLLVEPVGALPPKARGLWLETGDQLRLVSCPEGHAPANPAGLEPDLPTMGCQVEEIFADVRPGDRIFLDDGVFAGVVRQVSPQSLVLELLGVQGGRAKLKGEKGINLPDTPLTLPALTAKDREDLEFIARHGDLVALSFVQHRRDIEALIDELGRLGADNLGIILKIETQQAFHHLPDLLLTAMQHPPTAVMVARGDLGVEVGFERLSEVQEEILWLCEAAHVPVIWATQVLETLAQGGLPSRAEVTDAAMASRAECVMLNKGPYIQSAMVFLRDVAQRMQAHHRKKTAMLRQLSISQPLPRPDPTAIQN
jgi:pyruvate kinase